MSEGPFLAPGTLLAAWPGMDDPNFGRSLVLICQHDARGAYGLVLNRPEGHELAELVDAGHPLGGLRSPVYIGGPVDLGRLQFLHALPERLPGGLRVGTSLWLGGRLECLVDLLAAHPRSDLPVRLFLGYSGWGAGQLEEELAGCSWIPLGSDDPRVFRGDGEGAWSEALAARLPRPGLGFGPHAGEHAFRQ